MREIKGEAVIDVLADIIEPVANIAQDEEIKEILKKEIVEEGVDTRALAIERLKNHVPKLIKNHKQDVITILAVLAGEDVDDYRKNLTFAKLFSDVTELLNDAELVSFFTSQVSSGETEDTESESTSTTSEQPLTLA